MTQQPFDVFIPVAPKDAVKLPFVLDGVINNVIGFNRIHVALADGVTVAPHADQRVVYHNERDVFDFDKTAICYRPGWQYQQYLKLFQNVTECAWYLTLDCDIVILRTMKLWDNSKPVWWLGSNQYHKAYFDFQEKMIGIGKVSPFSWIADMNLFNKGIVLEMLCRFGYAVETFMARAVDITTKNCYMGEPEFYGSYVDTYHKGMYCLHNLSVIDGGAKQQNKREDSVFSLDEIRKLIARHSTGAYDVMPIHSWFTETLL